MRSAADPTRYAWSMGRSHRIVSTLLVVAAALWGASPTTSSAAPAPRAKSSAPSNTPPAIVSDTFAPSSSPTARGSVVRPTFGVRRWPGRTITYWDASRERIAVLRAVSAWNRSGLRIKFIRARSARAAQLIIRNSRDVPNGCGTGIATVGYVEPPRKAFINILTDPTTDQQRCGWPGQTLVVAHELGHVLGLGHAARGCRLMNTTFVEGIAPSGCVTAFEEDDYIARSATWRCRILEPADVRAAVRLYGGVVRPVRANPNCDLVAPLAAPTLTASWNPVELRVDLTIQRPGSQSIAPFLRARADRTERFELHRSRDTCASEHSTRANPILPTLIPPTTWTALPGSTQSEGDAGVSTGSWCYSAWAIDQFGKFGRGPATATVLVPEPPATA